VLTGIYPDAARRPTGFVAPLLFVIASDFRPSEAEREEQDSRHDEMKQSHSRKEDDGEG